MLGSRNAGANLARSILSEHYKPDDLCENIGKQYLTRSDSFSHFDSSLVKLVDTTGRLLEHGMCRCFRVEIWRTRYDKSTQFDASLGGNFA